MIVGGGEIKVNDSLSNNSQGRDRFMHPKRGSDFMLAGDKKCSEGAIFETPRDHRHTNNADKQFKSSLLNIAGILKISKHNNAAG